MRKVLLATTALVAMGGVSAASADITVTGSAAFNYVTTSGGAEAAEDREIGSQTDVKISASTAFDNGMSASGFLAFDESAPGGDQSADGDDAGWTLSGDFGSISFGGAASATLGAMATDVTADEGTDLHADYIDPANEHIPHMDVSMSIPAIAGIGIDLGLVDGDTVGATEDDGNGTGMGLTYSMDAGSMAVTLNYASYSTGASNSEISSTGAKIVSGDASVIIASNKTGNYTGTSVGATYALSDSLTVQGYTGTGEDSSDTDFESENTGVGLTYTVTTGMKVSVTHNSFTGRGGDTAGADQSGSRTALALDVTF